MLHPQGVIAAPRRTRRRASAHPLRTALGYLALLVGVFAAAVLAVRAPLIVFGLFAALAFFGLTWTKPKAALAVTLIVAMISPQLQAAMGAVGGVADEAMIFGAAAIIVARRVLEERSIIWLPGTGWFAVFLLAGVAGAILYGTPLVISLQGATLLTKCVVFAIALSQVHWSPRDLEGVAKGGFVLAIVLIAFGIINLAIPHQWTAIFGGSNVQFTFGIPSIIGPFRQPAAYGRMAVILASSILAYQFFVRASWKGYIVALLLGGLSLFTFRVKSLVGLLVVTTGLVLRAGNALVLAIIAGLLPALIAIVGPGLFVYVFGDVELYYGEGQESARSRLTDGGLQVAQEHFPLGVGLGRFGSATAADYYSPEYLKLGFQNVYGLRPEAGEGQFLNDTQWPALLGETGWLGTIAFVIGAILAVRILFLRTSPAEPKIVRWIRVSGVAWFVLIMLDSVAAPSFSSPPSFLFLFAAVGIVASIRNDLRTGALEFPDAGAVGGLAPVTSPTDAGLPASPPRAPIGAGATGPRRRTQNRSTISPLVDQRIPEHQMKEAP